MLIELCTNHTGKMEGIKSVSTSVLLNPNCQRNQKIKGSICSHCYAETLAKMYTALGQRLERNTKILTESVIPFEELPDLTGEQIFRLEAFGDLHNDIQLTNYVNIALKNPAVCVTLYTKMYDLVKSYFSKNKVPENLTLVISSMMVNKPINLSFMDGLGFRKGQLKSFTVYDKDFIKSHHELKINCGARCCNKCRICYLRNEIVEVNEILKSDRDSVEHYLNWLDPKYVEKTATEVMSIMDLWRS